MTIAQMDAATQYILYVQSYKDNKLLEHLCGSKEVRAILDNLYEKTNSKKHYNKSAESYYIWYDIWICTPSDFNGGTKNCIINFGIKRVIDAL